MSSRYKIQLEDPTDIDSIGFQSRMRGLEIRDCFLILEPNLEVRLGLVTRPNLDSTVLESVVRSGEGVIDIDRCRVSADWENDPNKRGWQGGDATNSSSMFGTGGVERVSKPNKGGRFPTNLIIKHGAECYVEGTRKVSGASTSYTRKVGTTNTVYGDMPRDEGYFQEGYGGEDGKEEIPNWICEPSCPANLLDAQSGNRPGCKSPSEATQTSIYRPGQGGYQKQGPIYPDEGGASRFFQQVQTEEELDEYLKRLIRSKNDA